MEIETPPRPRVARIAAGRLYEGANKLMDEMGRAGARAPTVIRVDGGSGWIESRFCGSHRHVVTEELGGMESVLLVEELEDNRLGLLVGGEVDCAVNFPG